MDRLTHGRRDRIRYPEAFSRDRWVETFAASLPPESRVLDAGAGSSKYRPLFSHCRYESQDSCQYQGDLVQYLKPIDHVGDITRIQLPDACMDAVLCTEVLEHVSDPVAVLREFYRLLKPNAPLRITAPLLAHVHMEPYHYVGGFTHYWFEHWLPVCGFSVESIIRVGGPGRSCTAFADAFHAAWSKNEKRLPVIRRSVSFLLRMPVKLWVQYVMPEILPKLDPWLGQEQIYSGSLVAARRRP